MERSQTAEAHTGAAETVNVTTERLQIQTNRISESAVLQNDHSDSLFSESLLSAED